MYYYGTYYRPWPLAVARDFSLFRLTVAWQAYMRIWNRLRVDVFAFSRNVSNF